MYQFFFHRLSSDLLTFGLMATVSLCMGLLLNQLHDHPVPLLYQTKAERLGLGKEVPISVRITTPIPRAWPSELSLEEFRTFAGEKQGLILDARPEIFYRFGRIPGAISLPRDDFQAGYAKVKDLLEKDKNRRIAVYCSGSSCEDSELLRAALVKQGYAQVAVFKGGWAAWTGAGLPEEKTP